MGWKNFSYWFKGGIILGIVSFAINLLMWLFLGVSNDSGIILGFFNLFSIYLVDLFTGEYNYSLLNHILLIIITFVVWFVIGAVIGWIVGKVKEKSVKRRSKK